MIKELKSFSPCEIMSCSRQHHKMSPDTPRPQRAAPHCRPREGQVRAGRAAGPAPPGRTGPEPCRRPREQQGHRRTALDFYRGLRWGGGGKEGRLQTTPSQPARLREGVDRGRAGSPGLPAAPSTKLCVLVSRPWAPGSGPVTPLGANPAAWAGAGRGFCVYSH